MANVAYPNVLNIVTAADANDNILVFPTAGIAQAGNIPVTIEVLSVTTGIQFSLNEVITANHFVRTAGANVNKFTVTMNIGKGDALHFKAGNANDKFLVSY